MPMLNGALTEAEASVQTVRGRAAIHWTRHDGGFTVCVSVPPSCTGEIVLPECWQGEDTLNRLSESGCAVCRTLADGLRHEAGSLILTVPSGNYSLLYC